MKFRCWRPEVDQTEENGEVVEANFSAEAAAEKFVSRNFDRWEYPEEVTVFARRLPSAEVSPEHPVQVFLVEVRAEPTFYARLKK